MSSIIRMPQQRNDSSRVAAELWNKFRKADRMYYNFKYPSGNLLATYSPLRTQSIAAKSKHQIEDRVHS